MTAIRARGSWCKVTTVGARFTTLDAMRGVAALVVVALHASDALGGVRPRFGHLAVDLFFVLSGFVLAKRYDADLQAGASPLRFMRMRARRLFPLYAVGTGLGFALLFLTHELRGSAAVAAAGAAAALMLPSVFTAQQNAHLFPTNFPAWSLFYEFWVANGVWALFWKRLHGPGLMLVIASCALVLVACEKLGHSLALGSRLDDLSLIAGVARVGFSFGMGLALARQHSRAPPRTRVAGGALLAGLLAIFCLPLSGVVGRAYELACVLVFFPACVFWGAQAIENLLRIGRWLGDASFAIYAVHAPLLALTSKAVARIGPHHGAELQLLFTLALVPIGLVLARVDERARATLLRRWPVGEPQRSPTEAHGAVHRRT